jgi:hypothetical protein
MTLPLWGKGSKIEQKSEAFSKAFSEALTEPNPAKILFNLILK